MKNQVITIVAIIVVIVLGTQAYMLLQLNERINRLTELKQAVNSAMPNLPGPAVPQPIPDDDFFKGQTWNPYEEMQHLQDEMEHMFGQSFSRFHMHSPLGSLNKSPEIDLQDKPDQYVVTVNAPGADESSISVKLEGQLLRIGVKTEQRKDENGGQNNDYRYRERFVGEFQRILTLPGPADAATMNTQYQNGVLTITIPKK
ncbi:MAG: Hsp20/alpha crystallin family protein [Methylococcales bacterium]|nr:Hsp20/alpha crystallin family protein [Methylococcales bacterium]